MNIDLTVIVLLGSIVFFGGAAVLALAWAVRDGQFQNFERSAKTIFDPAEPIGEMTDYFPDAPHEPTRSAPPGLRVEANRDQPD
jgi:cbb3-type cytochrome oxidase maturation protein